MSQKTAGQIIETVRAHYAIPSNANLGNALKIIWASEGKTVQYSEAEVLNLANSITQLIYEDFESVSWNTTIPAFTTLLTEDFESSTWNTAIPSFTTLLTEDFESSTWNTTIPAFTTLLTEDFESATWGV